MFDGKVGLFDGEVELKVSLDAKPIQLPPRAIALSVLPKLKAELDQMEREGIIRPCPETTDWVHNLVIVSKKNGDIRLCLDPKNLNKYLIRSVHHTASWEDASASFAKDEFFSTLDAKSGYWSKKLSATANFSQRSTLHSRSTASFACRLDSLCRQKFSASRWTKPWQASQARSPVRTT